MADSLPITKEALDAMIAERIGAQRAEYRAEMQGIGDDIIRRSQPSFIKHAITRSDAEMKPGEMLPRLLMSIVAGAGKSAACVDFAHKRWGDKASGMQEVIKSLEASDFTGAGALISETISSDFIEVLRPAVIVRRLGAQTVPMPNGSITIRRQTSSTTAQYLGETQAKNVVNPAFGHVKLSAKQLVAKVSLSNKAIRYSSVGIEQRVMNDAKEQMRRKEDAAFIRGTGTEFTPRGILNWCLATQKNAMTATPDHVKVNTDLGKAVLELQEQNVAFQNPGWMWAPRTENYLKTLLTSQGQYAFRAEMLAGTLWGYPFGSTTQIPTNLGGGSNESEVYLVDFAEMMIGETFAMNVAISNEAAYADETGTIVSAFDQDETVIKVQTEHDFGVRYPEAIAMITGVTWI